MYNARYQVMFMFGETWLNYERNFFIQTPHIVDLETLAVSELMSPGTNSWNRELVEAIFF